jgi:hypothetical protein
MQPLDIEEIKSTTLKLFIDAKEAGKKVDRDYIETMLNQLTGFAHYSSLTKEDWKVIGFYVESNVNVDIDERSIILLNPKVERWLDHKRDEIDWNYWHAFKSLLSDQGRTPNVIRETEKVVDEILDSSGDPSTEGAWARRGLVMGNVQSGKTQNYLALINKAIDSGYKVIIVLGGHLNELRKQTQERVDAGVIGKESKARFENSKVIGVGKHRGPNYRAAYLTTTDEDFSKKLGNSFGIHFSTVDGPIVFVIKKWASILENLYEWIKDKHELDPAAGKKLSRQMMLIDDEADYASINTKHDRGDITAINNNIRRLLSLFERSTYIGYTATPFANIFIDPETEKAVVGDDLFPKDFMVRIPTPDSYVGQKHFFQLKEEGSEDPVTIVNDNTELLPIQAKKDTPVGVAPESLKEAVRTFLLTLAIRMFRGQPREHCTMLVNVTHLTLLQDGVAEVIDEYMDEIRNGANFALGYSPEKAINKSTIVAQIHETFRRQFSITESFEEIYGWLKKAIHKTRVMAVHGKSKDKLDYAAYKANGLSVIVVGGHKLSRGLTLEGLTVSYFTRNSKTYDTLMQMCRWFGYRPGYKDLCKLFITEESFEWYEFISNAIDELYAELERMSEQKKTPSEFGLKVREHPGSLLITAKQKMNSAHKHTRSLDLAGSRIRKFEFYVSDVKNEQNLGATQRLADKLSSEGLNHKKTKDGSTIFDGVTHSLIVDFISETQFVQHEVTDHLVQQYIAKLRQQDLPKFSVCFKNIKSEKDVWWSKLPTQEGSPNLPTSLLLNDEIEPVRPMKRRLVASTSGNTVFSKKQELGDPHDERYFLPCPDKANKEKRPSDYIAHSERSQPGLIIYLFSVGVLPDKAKKEDEGLELFVPHRKVTMGYSLSFPVHENLKGKTRNEIESITRSTKVSYIANKVWKDFSESAEMDFYYDDDE